MIRRLVLAADFAALALPAAAQQGPSPQPGTSQGGGTMTVHLLGPITSESMAELVRAAQDAVLTGADEIQIGISSVGGKVNAARYAVNALSALPIRVVTVAMSDVSSSAVALFCAGERRHVAPGASIYLHQLTRFAERSRKTAAAQEREDEIVNGWYDGMLERCLADPADMAGIAEYQQRDLILDRDEAYRLGFGNAPFEDLRQKRYFGRATIVVPQALPQQ